MTTEIKASDLRLPAEVLQLVERASVDSDLTESALLDAFARLAFSQFTEPGDAVAGALLSQMPATSLLQAFLDAADPHEFGGALPAELLVTLTDHFGNGEQIIRDAFERWMPRRQLAPILSGLQSMIQLRASFITPSSAVWPVGLADLELSCPIVLWARGRQERLAWLNRSISVVGSRDSSLYGRDVVVELVGDLTTAGIAVVSGGAFGIDALAHQAALAVSGKTVAVMAGGLDSLYPAANRALLEEVIDQGLVIAEATPAAAPTKWRFLQRNRLIAALTQATIVVEAGHRSGSINTANHANQLGRPVGAIPGRINSVHSAGCHRLIRAGQAELISSSSDALDLIGASSFQDPAGGRERGPLETRALDAIGFGMLSLREVRQQAGLTETETKIALSALELFGEVQRIGAKWVRSQTTL